MAHKPKITVAGALCGLLAMLLAAGIASANGAPVDIFLDYLPNVSNWGPQDAKGQAVVAVGEGEVDLEVTGLPRLEDGHYTVWLESRAERELYPVGSFNAGQDGTGRLRVLLDDLPYQEYRMLLISVEPEPDPSSDPDPRRSLAGMFPNPAVLQPYSVLTNTITGRVPGAGTGETGAQPAHLPVTGSRPQAPWAPVGAAAAAVCIVCVFGHSRQGDRK